MYNINIISTVNTIHQLHFNGCYVCNITEYNYGFNPN